MTIAFKGEFDLASQGEFKRRLACAEADSDVVIDLTAVSYVDSSCVAELLLFSHSRRAAGLPPETILVTSGNVAKVLEMTGVSKVCRVVNV